MLVSAVGCDSPIPTFPPVGFDAGLECGDEELGSCASTEICLQGRCYAKCSDTSPCGPREECSSSGQCVPRVSDAGEPADGGPPDPCETVTCEAPTPHCRAGICLACLEAVDCVGMDPNTVCDRGRGICVPAAPAVCAPCNAPGNCPVTDPAMHCETRDTPAPTERVCVSPCDTAGACASGFECEMTTMLCVPKFNFSCTGLRAALDATVCAVDADCAPAGATSTNGLFTGSCFAAVKGAPLTCHVPCGLDVDCPAGTTCNGSFCI